MAGRDWGLVIAGFVAGGAVGVGGFFAGLRSGRGPEAGPAKPAAAPDLGPVLQKLAGIESRLGKLESRPGVQEALDDPAIRGQLAAALIEAKSPEPPRMVTQQLAWRRGMTDKIRVGYQNVLDQMKAALKPDDATWEKLQAVLKAHFAPIEAKLSDYEQGKGNAPPVVRDIVAPQLPTTLAAVRLCVSPDAYAVFDKWRHDAQSDLAYGMSRGDFFLTGDELVEYRSRRDAALNWGLVSKSLESFLAGQKFSKDQKLKVESLTKSHVENVTRHVVGKGIFFNSPEGRAYTRGATKALEVGIKLVVGEGGLAAYQAWRLAPDSRVWQFFGDSAQSGKPPWVRTDGGPPPVLPPSGGAAAPAVRSTPPQPR